MLTDMDELIFEEYLKDMEIKEGKEIADKFRKEIESGSVTGRSLKHMIISDLKRPRMDVPREEYRKEFEEEFEKREEIATDMLGETSLF